MLWFGRIGTTKFELYLPHLEIRKELLIIHNKAAITKKGKVCVITY